MPYTRGKLKGQLKSSEIRKIVRLHNEMSKIKIPPRLDRDGLIKFIETSGYKIDHENEKLIMTKSMPKDFSLKEAQEKFPVKPRKKKEVKPDEKKDEVLAIEDKKKVAKPVKSERNFKVERFERTKMIQQISSEIGKTFNPFKILEMKASQETPELVKSKCRELRLKNHPDKGGDKEKFDKIQKACDVLLKTQTIIKKSGNDKDVGDAVKKPDKIEKSREGWKKYFKMVEDNKELLKNNKIAPPFSDSYSFYKTNRDVREGQSNMNNKWSKWIEILEKRIKEIKEKKPDEKIEDKKQEPPKKKRTKEEISDDRFDNFLVPEINERVVPLLRDWLKNKDDQLYKKIKTFKMWKVPPVKDEDTGAILKKGKKNPKPEYYKEKDKLLKEVKKRFTEIYKKNNFSTRGSAFNNGYNDFVDGVLKGFGSKLFKIEPDEKLQKEMKERRKKEFERKKKEKGE